MPVSPFLRQLSIAAATLFIAVSVGASMAYAGVLMFQLKKKDSEFSIDLDMASWIGSIHGLAGIPGAIAPVIMQWKGRKLTFIAACLILISGWMLVYIATSTATILLSESLLGFASSVLMTVCYDSLTEMITPTYRNIAVQSSCVMHALGMAATGAMTRFLYWRVISIILCLPAVIGVLISFTWLESPLWLAYKEDLHKCKTNFVKLRGTAEHSMKELQEVMAAHRERTIRNKSMRGDSFVKQTQRQVTSRDFLIPALHIFILMQHIYWSGIAVIMIYSIELISKATHNDTAAFIGNIIINFLFVICAGMSAVFVRFYKNKTTLLVSTCGATASLLGACVVTYLQSVGTMSNESILILYFLVGYIMTTSAGQVPVEMAIAAELIPVKHRGLGGALYVILACSLVASTLKVSPYLIEYLGLWGTFLIYTLNSAVCGLLIWKYVPETKGKTLLEIENFYTHGTFEIRLSSKDEMEPIGTL